MKILKILKRLHAILMESAMPTAPYPHCDGDVLHAPGSCRFCDEFPERQSRRVAEGVCFTGEDDPSKKPCPATLRRSAVQINVWPGNRPHPHGGDQCTST